MEEFDEEKALEMFETFKSDKLENKDYETAKSKAKMLGSLSKDFLTLLKIIKSYFKGEFNIPKSELLLIIGAIVYVATPIDALPDVIPVVGYVDDISVVAFVIKKIKNLINQYNSEFK